MSSTTTPESKPRHLVMIVAGEASGDLHGANLVRAMKESEPSLRFCGVGGLKLEAEGVMLVARSSEMAVVGITEVIAKIRFILGVFLRLRKMLRTEKPDLLILIDYPDFNLRLAASAKAVGVPVFYYISPQVWAWRKSRVRQIRHLVDRMAVILPFEEAFYAKMGYAVNFVGHPLLDIVKRTRSRAKCLADFGLADKRPLIALLPGSRDKEVRNLLPIMLEAAVRLKERYPDSQFILPLADTVTPDTISRITQDYAIPVKVISGQTYDAVGLADVAIVASGTATLETALLEVPMIIIYKISPLTAAIGKHLIHIKHIGLVNIIMEESLVPELIQEEANVARLADEAVDMLENRFRRQAIQRGLATISTKLGSPGAALRAARLALGIIEARR